MLGVITQVLLLSIKTLPLLTVILNFVLQQHHVTFSYPCNLFGELTSINLWILPKYTSTITLLVFTCPLSFKVLDCENIFIAANETLCMASSSVEFVFVSTNIWVPHIWICFVELVYSDLKCNFFGGGCPNI